MNRDKITMCCFPSIFILMGIVIIATATWVAKTESAMSWISGVLLVLGSSWVCGKYNNLVRRTFGALEAYERNVAKMEERINRQWGG